MKLGDVLAIHPGDHADSAALEQAIATATERRAELLQAAHTAELVRADGLLEADDRALQAADKDASQARLGADRVSALLAKLQADHAAAREREEAERGRQVIAELQADAAEVDRLLVEFERWRAEDRPKIAELIGVGLRAERAALDARAAYLAKIKEAFAAQSVRDAAPPGGLTVGKLPDRRMSDDFPGWSFR